MNPRLCLIVLTLATAVFGAGCGQQSSDQVEAAAVSAVPKSASPDPLMQRAETLIEKFPNSPVGYTQLASIYAKKARETGDFSLNSKAETAVAKALEVEPADATARKLQASLALTFHRFSEALELGTKLQQQFPNDSFVYGVLTDANAELGLYEKAVDAVQKMIDLKPDTASYARAAHMRSLYGDHNGSVEMFKSAARSADPSDKEAQSWCLVQLGDELWRNGKYGEAETVFDEALINFPNYYLAVAAKGKVRAARGDLAGAEKFLADAQNRVPNAEMTVLLQEVYTLAGDSERADQQAKLLEAVEEKLAQAGDQRQLALFWADRDTRLNDALVIGEREYQARKDIYTADVYAWCLYKTGRTAEAKKIIGEAMRLKTKDARILYHAGMIDAAAGDTIAAKKNLAAAIKLHPAFDIIQIQKAKDKLAAL
jgi:tetratricopeptide (TPR) repeat protein